MESLGNTEVSGREGEGSYSASVVEKVKVEAFGMTLSGGAENFASSETCCQALSHPFRMDLALALDYLGGC